MKHPQSYLIAKLQKNFSVSSLVWATLVTIIVLALAASASAQEIEAQAVSNVSDRAILAPTQELATPNELRSAPASGDLRAVPPIQQESPRSNLMSEIQERRTTIEAKRLELANRNTERVSAIKENVRSAIKAQTARLTAVLEQGINRMQEASERLRARTVEVSARGIDVSSVIVNLDEADRTLLAAKDALYGIEVNVSYATLSDTPREDWQSARTQFLTVKQMLTDARALLRNAINDLRVAITNSSTNATPEMEVAN